MSKVDITLEIKSLGQTNGKTYHVRSNCGNQGEKEGISPDSDAKLAETLLLLLAITKATQAEAAADRLKAELTKATQAESGRIVGEPTETIQVELEKINAELERIKAEHNRMKRANHEIKRPKPERLVREVYHGNYT